MTVSLSEETDTLATPDADVDAENVSACPSGSVKYCPRLTVAVLPACTVCAGMLPLGCGARFGTMTAKLCWAWSPPGSRAVTVTAVLPGETPATVTDVPEIRAVATEGFEDATA